MKLPDSFFYEGPAETDHLGLAVDFLKHLATLATGSVVLIATLLEKVFATPIWRLALVLSLAGFVTTVILSLLVYRWAVFLDTRGTDYRIDLIGPFTWKMMFRISIWSFVFGVVCLAVFTVRNIYSR